MSLASGVRLGPYEILAPIGAGGMGEVYRARDTRLGREIALKVLPQELSRDRDRLARFEQEARAASALNHPNIVTVHDIGQLEETPYIAMEFVEGKTLRELSASEPLPMRKLLSIAPQIADGLAKAHAVGIVHRDLKPENLMVSKDGFVKILDFGLAKLVAPESGGISAMPTLAKPETHPGTVMGTVAYMSPEQASGQPLDYRSDQFSLGSILYEAATGQRAFDRKTAPETMSAIIREEPKPIGQVAPQVPLPLRWIVGRCLAKDPEERYASTRDLARDLANIRDHVSEVSGEVLPPEPVRRRRRAVPLAAAALILLGGLVAGWVARSLRQKAQTAPSFRRLTFRQGLIGNARFAPDGQTILYGATWRGEQHPNLYLTRLESPESSRPFDFGNADILSVSPFGELAIVLDQLKKPILARVSLAGGVPRPLVEGVGYASADWAPDGKQLAVVRTVNGVTRLEFPIGKVLLEGSVDSPRISPRGDRIAFFTRVDSGVWAVSIIGTDGSGKRILSSGWAETAGVPCWTRDGKEIWFTAGEEGQPYPLYAVDLSGKRRLVLRVPAKLEIDDLSADGRVLVGHHTLLNVLRGSIDGEARERDLSWLDTSIPSDLSDDGKTLLISEQGEGTGPAGAVYLRKTDGSPAVRLGEGIGLGLSPDGAWVLTRVARSGAAPQLVLLPTGPGQPRQLLNDRFERFGGAQWFPDGKKILFSGVERGGRARIYVQDLESGQPRAISPEGVLIPWRRAMRSVSPDGKYVVGFTRPNGGAMLYPLDGGRPRAVAGLAEVGEFPFQWTTDGVSLYVYRGREVPQKIWLLEPTTGTRRLFRELPSISEPEGAFRALVTPDGRSYVYGFSRLSSELYLVEGLK